MNEDIAPVDVPKYVPRGKSTCNSHETEYNVVFVTGGENVECFCCM